MTPLSAVSSSGLYLSQITETHSLDGICSMLSDPKDVMLFYGSHCDEYEVHDDLLDCVMKSKRFSYKKIPLGVFAIFLKRCDIQQPFKPNMIGFINILPRSNPGVLNISYVVHPHFRGRGFASQAVSLLLR